MTDTSNRLIWINHHSAIIFSKQWNQIPNTHSSLHKWIFKEIGEQRFPFVENTFSISNFSPFNLVMPCRICYACTHFMFLWAVWYWDFGRCIERARSLSIYTICVCLHPIDRILIRELIIGRGELGSLVKIMRARAFAASVSIVLTRERKSQRNADIDAVGMGCISWNGNAFVCFCLPIPKYQK